MSNEIKKYKGSGLENKSLKGGLNILGGNLSALSKGLGKIELPRLFYQLVVFLIDGSGSMTCPGITGVSKGEEIEKELINVFERLKLSKNSNCFDMNVFAYANGYKEILPITNISKIDTSEINLNPCKQGVDYRRTDIREALISAKENTLNYLDCNQEKNTQVLFVIFSDGAFHFHEKTVEISNEIQNIDKVTISSVLFEDKRWKEKYNAKDLEYLKTNLSALSSNEDLFFSSVNPEEIRKHMIKSISTVSKID